MSKPPVLKPREVIRVLLASGFVQFRQRGSTNSSGILMAAAPPWPTMEAVTSVRRCCVRLPRTSAWPGKSSSNIF